MTKEKLIQELIKSGYLKTPTIIDAFNVIDRIRFIPQELEKSAYINEPLPIGHGQTISQPLTVAFMLELLCPTRGEKILDIGSGSGWQTALLAHIVGAKGKIIAIEKVLPLKAMTEENVEKFGFIKKGIVKVIWDDGSKGAPENLIPKSGPVLPARRSLNEGGSAVEGFDKIIAAAAAESIPKAWKNQLKIGGRLVAPVKNSIVVIDKISETEFKEEAHFGFRFVPLVTD